MIAERGSIVIVPFPFSDRSTTKRRPAVVLSVERFNQAYGLTTLAMITTAKRVAWASDVTIRDWQGAGLREPCVVRPRMATVENGFLLERVGRLGDADQAQLRRSVLDLFGWH